MIAAQLQITDQDARTISATKGSERLGQLASTSDGRVYAYSQAGASNLSAGKIVSGLATTANHVTQTGVVTAVGDRSVSYTLGATAAASDLYADGYFAVDVGPGQNVYSILGNTNATSTNSYAVTVNLKDPITVATSTSSKFSLYPSEFKSTVLYDHNSITVPVVGVPNVAVTAAYYYWGQVTGYCATLSDGVIAKNTGAIPSDATDGAVETEATTTIIKRIGYAPEATVTTTYLPINLTIVQ